VRAAPRLLALGLILAASQATAAGKKAEKDKPAKIVVKFKADKVVLGPDLKSATLTGHVRVTVGDVKITCKKLSLAYGGGKQVASFEARGKVKLVMKDLEAFAEELDYDAKARHVVMRGSCRVKSKSVDLTGEKISLALDTRKISIDKAAGTIDMGNQTF
jgi:lipopolysaccharide transport protein LptA